MFWSNKLHVWVPDYPFPFGKNETVCGRLGDLTYILGYQGVLASVTYKKCPLVGAGVLREIQL